MEVRVIKTFNFKICISFLFLNFLFFWAQLLIGGNSIFAQDDAEDWIELGLEYKNKGKNEEALGAFESAVLSNPNNADAHLQMAFIFQILERYESALNSYHEGLRLAPNHRYVAEAYFNMSVAADRLEDNQLSIKYQKKALQAYTDRGDYGNVFRSAKFLQYLSQKFSHAK